MVAENKNNLLNPNSETQVKDKPIKTVPRIIFIAIISILMITGYIFSFSLPNFPEIAGTSFIGIFDQTNYTGCKTGDLCIVKNIDDWSSLNAGDIVFYTLNGETKSQEVVSVESYIVRVKDRNGVEQSISKYNIDGVLTKKIAVIGFFVGFITSIYGAVTFSIILFVYLCIITIKRINYENTEKGKQLRDKYLAMQKAQKQAKQEKKKISKYAPNGLMELLQTNAKISLDAIKNAMKKHNMFETYKLIIDEVHTAYFDDKRTGKDIENKICLLIELCVCFDHIDMDVEYKLIDLSLKSSFSGFDFDEFLVNSKAFLKNANEEDLYNFASIMFVLISRNRKFKNKQIREIVACYGKKLKEMELGETSRCQIIFTTINKLLK